MFLDCDGSFYNFAALKRHLKANHTGNGNNRRCALCKQSFPNLDEDEIDLIHYNNHNLGMYHCIFCSKYESSIQQMQEHLSDCHSNKLPCLMHRTLNGDGVDDEPKICRLRLISDEELFRCSSLSETQINYKNPLLGSPLSDISAVPNDKGLPFVNYESFITSYKDNMRNNDNTAKLYGIETLPLAQPPNSEDFTGTCS